LILLGLLVATATTLVLLDTVTAFVQQRSVSALLDDLMQRKDLEKLPLSEVENNNSLDKIGHSTKLSKPDGIDVIKVELELNCGEATVAAVDSSGKILVSSRDYRLIRVDTPGRYVLILTVLGPTVPPDGYRIFLRTTPQCSPQIEANRLADPPISEWNAPLLAAGFRKDGENWRILRGMGPEWVARAPSAEWIVRTPQ
jgi:hypothetical protein